MPAPAPLVQAQTQPRTRGGGGAVRAYVAASVAILRFYFSVIFRFGDIHPRLPSGRLLAELTALPAHQPSGPLHVRLGAQFAREFNSRYDELRKFLRARLGAVGATEVPFERTMARSFAVRLGWVALIAVAVLSAGDGDGLSAWARVALLLVGLLQFVVAPLSLPVCLMRLGTNVWDCLMHYACNLVAAAVVGAVTGDAGTGAVVRFGGPFLGAFLALDFALNLAVHLRLSEPFGARRLAKHMLYGTLNTKTYFLVVVGALTGLELDLGVVLLASALTHLAYRAGVFEHLLHALGLPGFAVMFYCEHRINHCPVVYAHAHKQHHYLHDTTAFDAHVYGSGANEEYAWVLAETLPCVLCPGRWRMFPYFLNLQTLWTSLTNKGGHTRTAGAAAASAAEGGVLRAVDCDPDNFHADHHTLHRANFGTALGPLLDFYFGTQGRHTRGAHGKVYTLVQPPADGSHGAPGDVVIVEVSELPEGCSNRTPFVPR